MIVCFAIHRKKKFEYVFLCNKKNWVLIFYEKKFDLEDFMNLCFFFSAFLKCMLFNTRTPACVLVYIQWVLNL